MHFDLDHHRIPGEYVGREVGDSYSLFLPFSLDALGTSFCCVRFFILGDIVSRNLPCMLPLPSAVITLSLTGSPTPRKKNRWPNIRQNRMLV